MTREDIEKKMHEAAEEIKPLVTTLVEALCEAHQKGYLAGVELGAKMAYPHWIPVEEELPKENTVVLIFIDLTERFQEETYLYRVCPFDGKRFDADIVTLGNVTHWMPIVPPRKEE